MSNKPKPERKKDKPEGYEFHPNLDADQGLFTLVLFAMLVIIICLILLASPKIGNMF